MLTAAEARDWVEQVAQRHGGVCGEAGDAGASCTRRSNHGRDHYDVRVERGWRSGGGGGARADRRPRDSRQPSLLEG